MPGYDGTGPSGRGPMTGGGRGFCGAEGIRPARPAAFGFGRGFRGGLRRFPGRGFGRGMYRNQPFYMSNEDELEVLKAEAEAARYQLEALNQRITAIVTNRGSGTINDKTK